MTLGSVAAALFELVLPAACAGCARPGHALCGSCGAAALHRDHMAGLPVVAAAQYSSGLRAALIAYKERDRRELAAPLGDLLAVAAAEIVVGVSTEVMLVPIPSARSVARRRGGDHVVRLARRCGRRLGLPVCNALSLTRSVQDGAGLSARARRQNLDGAMRAREAAFAPGRLPRPVSVVIVDDIVTTGATVREARRALSAAGWHVWAAAAVARTPLRSPALTLGGSASGTTYPTGLPLG